MKTAIITGASGGIGSAIARKLASENYTLALVYNSSENEIKKLKDELSTFSQVFVYKCDLKNESQIKYFIQDFASRVGKIDVLVNCAGVSQSGLIQDISVDDYYFIFDNNVKSAVLVTKYVSKYMINEKFGKIVNISSMWGRVGASMESLYSASKGAINALTLSLAKELGPSNINVNAICPGLIDTRMNKGYNAQEINDIIDETPLSRIGKPEDVASLVAFLASEESSFITGQIITIDGGLTL